VAEKADEAKKEALFMIDPILAYTALCVLAAWATKAKRG
jgi:hypothetical protein